jgi:hypothetical protein
LVICPDIWLVKKWDFVPGNPLPKSPEFIKCRSDALPANWEMHEITFASIWDMRLKVKTEETNIFTGHYHFAIIF